MRKLLPTLLVLPAIALGGCAVASALFASGAAMIAWVCAPLSTTRVSGSPTTERTPTTERSRPALSSMLDSARLRGAGPPNKASTACACAPSAVELTVPATGGVSE